MQRESVLTRRPLIEGIFIGRRSANVMRLSAAFASKMQRVQFYLSLANQVFGADSTERKALQQARDDLYNLRQTHTERSGKNRVA